MGRTEVSKEVDEIVSRYKGQIIASVGILQDIQSRYNYLPKDALVRMAVSLNIPLSQVFSLATFYKAFSLKPRGKHLISVCMGTACHVRGAPRIADEVQRRLNLKRGETTEDNKFTFEVVNCLGCCAIGPVMVIDSKYYEHMTVSKIGPTLRKYETGRLR